MQVTTRNSALYNLITNQIQNRNFFTIFEGDNILLLPQQIEKIYFYNEDQCLNRKNIKKIDLVDIVKYIKKKIENK